MITLISPIWFENVDNHQLCLCFHCIVSLREQSKAYPYQYRFSAQEKQKLTKAVELRCFYA